MKQFRVLALLFWCLHFNEDTDAAAYQHVQGQVFYMSQNQGERLGRGLVEAGLKPPPVAL
jgi:hypothetical protein